MIDVNFLWLQSDDEDNKSESIRSDLESQPCTPAAVHYVEKNNEDWTNDGVFRIPQVFLKT